LYNNHQQHHRYHYYHTDGLEYIITAIQNKTRNCKRKERMRARRIHSHASESARVRYRQRKPDAAATKIPPRAASQPRETPRTGVEREASSTRRFQRAGREGREGEGFAAAAAAAGGGGFNSIISV
jgi:hypothetical protein